MNAVFFILKMPLVHPNKISLVKVIVFLVSIVILLQLFHMCLLSRLEAKDSLPNADANSGRIDQDFAFLVDLMIKRILGSYVLDQSGSYQLINNIISPTGMMTGSAQPDVDITIATHTSSQNLKELLDLVENWDGPVSVSVFTYGSDAVNALRMMLYLHLCHKSVSSSTTFHMSYPLNRPPQHLQNLKSEKFTCDRGFLHTSRDVQENYAMEGVPYPNNLLRNLAIKSSRTPYIFTIDIDLIPSLNLREKFIKFIEYSHQNSASSVVFIVPVFEIKLGYDYPHSKQELVNAWNKGVVREFYKTMCWKCQKQTDYSRWKSRDVTDSLGVAHRIEWKDPYEPFYIARRTLPQYDERFKQYGFNRISQVCEMHVAGYEFAVLDNAFLLHKGFKDPGQFHAEKDKENARNKLLFRQFKDELKTRYPDTNRRC